ncbi:MAG: manganese transport protein [Solirubrobacterales bacterium]|nr:manganese transport protein [Solirubrobacterales bacterium]
MKGYLQIALGILAAIGGFVDIGDIVFATGAGALFGYQLIWAVVLSVIGIVTFSEMSGRVAIVTQRPVFSVVRQRMGFGLGLVTLIGSEIVNVLTLAAEAGGVALVISLLFNVSYPALLAPAFLILALVIWITPFEWIEKIFGYMGLCLVAYLVAAIHLHPDLGNVGAGVVPHLHTSATYLYFVVGLVAAGLMPYEVYFYSSGAVEERWKPPGDLRLNRINATLGFGLGGILSISLIVLAAEVFHPIGVQPAFLGTAMLGAQASLGTAGLVFASIGILFAVGGAAIDTCFAGAYSLAQFLGWEWGKYRHPRGAARFTITWMVLLGLALVIISTGVDPVIITEYAVIGSVVALPLSYLPILLVASDPTYMGKHVNGRISTALGWVYMAIIAVVAVAALPLLIITNAGTG